MNWTAGIACAVLTAAFSTAETNTTASTRVTVDATRASQEDSLAAIRTDYSTARKENALDAEVRGVLMERCRRLAENLEDAEERFEVLKYGIGLGSREEGLKDAVATLAEGVFRDFPNDADRLVPLITRSLATQDPRMLKRWAEASENDSIKAACLFAPVQGVLSAMRRGPDPDEATLASLMEGLNRIAEEYGDVPNPGNRNREGNTATWAESIAGPRFQLEHLRFGQIPPDIVAADLDGVEFRLSDYRGKVVVLDFWGDW